MPERFAAFLWVELRCLSKAMDVSFAYRRYRLPLRVPLRTAHGVWTVREGVVVQLVDEHGRTGWGEASPIPWFGTETTDEIEVVCRQLAEHGSVERFARMPDQVACLHHALTAARAELDAVSRDPGGDREKSSERAAASAQPAVVAAEPYLGVAALLPAGRRALDEVAPKSDLGFRIFKWKVGVADVADELGLLDDLCAELPDGAKLRLDANGAWTSRQAARWLERCADRPVEYVEQPVARDLRGAEDVLCGLAGDFPTPIALDESLVRDGEIHHWIELGWNGIYVIKPALLADVRTALSQLEKAKADVVFSSALETAVGARDALRVAFAWTGKPRALGFGVWPLFEDSRYDGPHLTPFLRFSDVQRLNAEAVWNALS
jgi:O-succinylbenzoate synthase